MGIVNRMLQKMRKGETILGLGVCYPAPGIIESMCRGWDFVWADAQHGQFTYDMLHYECQAAMVVGADMMIRCPGIEESLLSLYADLAPEAIMIPMVNNKGDAERIVKALRFPPIGNRSFSGRRLVDLYGRQYYKDFELCIVAQIENPEAVNNAYEIAGIEGVDLLFFGPDDFKISLGIPIDSTWRDNKDLESGYIKTSEAARKANKFCGTVAGSISDLETIIKWGYQLIVYGSDVAFLRSGSAKRLEEIQKMKRNM